MRGLSSELLEDWKRRVLLHCGVPLEKEADFSLALGYVRLDEQRTAMANDVCSGDTVMAEMALLELWVV